MSMHRKIMINALSSGRFSVETIEGREHLVTPCVSISLNSVMNRIFYPAAVVESSYQQLDRKPSPAGHPVINGRPASATDPVAMNKYNIGAFVMRPRIEEGQVINDLAIDIETAEKDERGVEVMRRIRNNERIGMSTQGDAALELLAGQFMGEEYDAVVRAVEWDHVANLLDEEPAGSDTFTVTNSKEGDVLVFNAADSVNELREQISELVRKRNGDQWAYVEDIMLDPQQVIAEVEGEGLVAIPFALDDDGNAELTGVGVPVKRVVSYPPITTATTNEGDDMEQETLVMEIIANQGNTLTRDDKARLMAMDEAGLIAAVQNAQVVEEVTTEAATEIVANSGQTVVPKEQGEKFQAFVANEAAFDDFQTKRAEERAALVETITNNTDITEEDLAGQDFDYISRLANSIKPEQDYSLQGADGSQARTVSNAGDNAAGCADFD